MARSSDRETVIRLRHQLQTCESSKRLAHARLDVFRQHLVEATTETVSIQSMTEILGELAAIRLLLSGVGGVANDLAL
jgi:hypothetical protein